MPRLVAAVMMTIEPVPAVMAAPRVMTMPPTGSMMLMGVVMVMAIAMTTTVVAVPIPGLGNAGEGEQRSQTDAGEECLFHPCSSLSRGKLQGP